MDYQGDIIRPPSEANSIILQVTTGCSHNKCTFCGAYRDKAYSVKPLSTIEADIRFAQKWCLRQKTLFLADGDALGVDHEILLHVLRLIRVELPWIRRVASYANSHNVLAKTAEQLSEYRELGLSRLYLGLESGHELTLRYIAKGADSKDMIAAATKVRNAGMFLSVTSLLGVGGRRYSTDHAIDTAKVLNQMQPNQVAILTLMILPNTALYLRRKAGKFQDVDQFGLFSELRTIVAGLKLEKTQLQANHASNYFSLNGRLPRDKERMLAYIDRAINGTVTLKPESLRFL